MQVTIFSRKDMEAAIIKGLPSNTAIISFCDPPGVHTGSNCDPVDFSGVSNPVFQTSIHDLDLDVLSMYGLTYDTYFPEADDLAKFIYHAREDGMDIICQCEYGQSRSAGCAAAILEHFYKTGISIFADYRYYPNQVVYHKVMDALEKYKKQNQA